MSKRSRVSEAEREQRRAADRQRLQRAAEQLLSSEGLAAVDATRATNGLARYSLLISGPGRSLMSALRRGVFVDDMSLMGVCAVSRIDTAQGSSGLATKRC